MPTSVRGVTLLDRTERPQAALVGALHRHGHHPALVGEHGTVSYAELDQRVDECAARLGTSPRLVLIEGANRLEVVVAYLAALRGRHAAVLVPRGAREQVLATFDPDVTVTAEGGWEAAPRRAGSAHDLHPDLALLLSTSGSTGAPRLVRLSHDNLESNASAIADYLGLGPTDRAITSLPLHYCYGLSVLNSHLAVGATVVLTDRSVVDPAFWDLAARHEVTGLAGVPHTFDLLQQVDLASLGIRSLRYLTQAGGRMRPEQVQRFANLGAEHGWDLFVMYGQTEATARMAFLPPSLAASHPRSIGIPIPGGTFELRPVDDAPPGVGELVYRGDNVMLGYADGPDDLALGATLDALATGDLARRDADGLYEIVGRRSRFAKLFGLRIDLDHLEVLLADGGIEASCTSDDERLVVGVVAPSDAGAARALVDDALDLPPSRLVVVSVDALPRLPNGKPDHPALARLADGRAPAAAPALTPLDGVDPGVLRAFVDVLEPASIDGDCTFVDLGGDSLSYVELAMALEEQLGELPPGWHTTPLRELSPRRPDRRRRLHAVEMTVVLRALSIVAVVGTHIKLFTVLGGAHLLLAIGGFNFGRFPQGPAGRLRGIARIAVPSMVWLALVAPFVDRIHLPHVLLVHGWFGDPSQHGGYWYIEAIVQILVPLTALLAIPAVRRIDARAPLAVPVAVLLGGLLVRFHVLEVPTVEPHDIRAHDIVWLFALGWVAAVVRHDAGRWLVTATAVAAVPGYFGEPAREAVVVAGLLLLAWVPAIRLPRLLARTTTRVAAASLYIYLSHWQVFPVLRDRAGDEGALAGSLLAGVLLWRSTQWATGRWRRRGQGPSRAGEPAALSVA